MSKDQRQREFNFIRQSFFQGLSMSVALIFYRITAPMLENQILLFLDANLWAFMLAFEGLVQIFSQFLRTFIGGRPVYFCPKLQSN